VGKKIKGKTQKAPPIGYNKLPLQIREPGIPPTINPVPWKKEFGLPKPGTPPKGPPNPLNFPGRVTQKPLVWKPQIPPFLGRKVKGKLKK